MFKPGKYYVGDPCYVFSHDTSSWSELLKVTNFFNNDVHEFMGHPIWAHSTAYGDGTYFDDEGREYGVDAGLIGVVSVDLLERDLDKIENFGHIIEFDKPFTPYYRDGTFHIGDITIETDDMIDEEEEENYCDEDDDDDWNCCCDEHRDDCDEDDDDDHCHVCDNPACDCSCEGFSDEVE